MAQSPTSSPTHSFAERQWFSSSELANREEEALINAAMGPAPYHKIRQGAIFRIEAVMQDFYEQTAYSVRDETAPFQDRNTWTEQHEEVYRECFEPPRESLKTGDYLAVRLVGDEMRVTCQFIIDLSDDEHRRFLRFRGHRGITWYLDIVSDSHAECESLWAMIQKRYFVMYELPNSRRDNPQVSFLGNSNGRLDLTPMRMADNRMMTNEELVLHYGGENILDFEKQLIDSLTQDVSGLHLLHGKAGVGKTSYLLHLIGRIKSRHELIYLPTQYFESISSPESFKFWAELAEKREDGKRTVLLVEDAEALIQARDQVDGQRASLVSNLLNSTDGILGQALGLHVIATFNTEVDKIDPALLRAGRLKSFQEFLPLDPTAAAKLAKHLGRKLGGNRENYTLADIYCGESKMTEKKSPVMGFGNSSQSH